MLRMRFDREMLRAVVNALGVLQFWLQTGSEAVSWTEEQVAAMMGADNPFGRTAVVCVGVE